MTHIGLFEGIGGFSLAVKWMGWETLAWCEWNEFGQKVLKYHFPNAEGFGDITKTDFTKYANRIDILTGGFPCQPYSVAGKRKGTEDDRHLWPEMLRAIREIQPRWVIGENVHGLINWSGGLVFHEVQTNLEAEGYEVFPYVLPACSVNAPHRRDRVWFVAHASGKRLERSGGRESESKRSVCESIVAPNCTNAGNEGLCKSEIDSDGLQFTPNATGIGKRSRASSTSEYDKGGKFMEGPEQGCNGNDNGKGGVIAYTEQIRLQGWVAETYQRSRFSIAGLFTQPNWGRWENFPTQPPLRDGDDGFSARLVGLTVSKHRNESIKAGGNAIVPQVAFQIMKTIEQYEAQFTNKENHNDNRG